MVPKIKLLVEENKKIWNITQWQCKGIMHNVSTDSLMGLYKTSSVTLWQKNKQNDGTSLIGRYTRDMWTVEATTCKKTILFFYFKKSGLKNLKYSIQIPIIESWETNLTWAQYEREHQLWLNSPGSNCKLWMHPPNILHSMYLFLVIFRKTDKPYWGASTVW